MLSRWLHGARAVQTATYTQRRELGQILFFGYRFATRITKEDN
jgi:hypothetical protein